MAQSKRSFNQARLERDLDDRIVPKGTYRDALNISIDTSEDANVGVIENLKGNELIANQSITGLSSSTNANAKVIGSCAHPEGNRIYYFVTGDKSDGIFEHNLKDNTVKTIIIDSSDFVASSPTKVVLPTFAFSDAVVTATVTKDGTIGVSATLGTVFSLTPDFGASVSTNTTRVIQAQVTVPAGYSNTGKFVTGTVTATQAAIAAPVVNILDCTNITATGVTLNAEYTNDSAGVTVIGFYYKANTGGSTTVTNFTNEFVIRSLSGRSANLSSGAPLWTDPFEGVAASDLTVKDKDGTTITSSQYDYQNLAGPQPNTIYFKSNLGTVDQVHAKLPITVSQTSTGATVSNALTAAQVQSSGTNAAVTPITSPFSKAITGLSASTTYAVVAYATNSVGTTLSSIKYFTTTASAINRPTADKLFIVPAISESAVENRNVGYGDFLKGDGNYYIQTVTGASSGLLSDSPASEDQITYSATGPSTVTFTDHGGVTGAKNDSKQIQASGLSTGFYNITASRSGYTSSTIQIKVGSPSNANRQSIFTPNITSTGSGTTPILGHVTDVGAGLSYNAGSSAAPTAVFKIGPFESSVSGTVFIPLQTSTPGPIDTLPTFSGFDASKLDISISGKTNGVDYTATIWDLGPALFGVLPCIMVECNPNTLNGGTASVTHTLNITYNY